MDLPTLRATIRDPRTDVTYRVFAYRDLSREEALGCIRLWHAAQKRKPKKGLTVDIATSLGALDP